MLHKTFYSRQICTCISELLNIIAPTVLIYTLSKKFSDS